VADRWQDWPTSGEFPDCIGSHSDLHRGRVHDLMLELDPRGTDYARLHALWAFAGNFEVWWCGWCGDWGTPRRRRAVRSRPWRGDPRA
jgi:hypothetical protein